MYHAVGTDVTGDSQRLYNMSPSTFMGQIDQLSYSIDAGLLNIYSLPDGITKTMGAVITFDDGYQDNLTVAAPILLRYNLPFTVFVTPKMLASGDPRYLSPATLKELSALPGVTIGAHGYSHEPLTTLSEQALALELYDSRVWIEDIIGTKVVTMSYPHGAVDQRVRTAVAKEGFLYAASSKFGAFRPGQDPLLISRTDIWANDTEKRFNAKRSGAWDWMGLISN